VRDHADVSHPAQCEYAPYPFPDAAAHNMQASMEPTCDVRFRARDLWPDSCDEALNHVGVFQSHLGKVGTA
jgi:nitrile hydratase